MRVLRQVALAILVVAAGGCSSSPASQTAAPTAAPTGTPNATPAPTVGATAPPTAGPTITISLSPAPSGSPAPSSVPTIAPCAPPDLTGTYTRTLTGDDTSDASNQGDWVLQISSCQYSIRLGTDVRGTGRLGLAAGGGASGTIVISGDTGCPGGFLGPGTYSYTFDGATLTFTEVADPRCFFRGVVFTLKAWTRQ